MAQRGLKGSQLKKTSSPGPTFRNAIGEEAADIALKADKPSSVEDIGATEDLSGAETQLSTADTYTDESVNTAVDNAINGVTSGVEQRLDALEAKMDELLQALKA